MMPDTSPLTVTLPAFAGSREFGYLLRTLAQPRCGCARCERWPDYSGTALADWLVRWADEALYAFTHPGVPDELSDRERMLPAALMLSVRDDRAQPDDVRHFAAVALEDLADANL